MSVEILSCGQLSQARTACEKFANLAPLLTAIILHKQEGKKQLTSGRKFRTGEEKRKNVFAVIHNHDWVHPW